MEPEQRPTVSMATLIAMAEVIRTILASRKYDSRKSLQRNVIDKNDIGVCVEYLSKYFNGMPEYFPLCDGIARDVFFGNFNSRDVLSKLDSEYQGCAAYIESRDGTYKGISLRETLENCRRVIAPEDYRSPF